MGHKSKGRTVYGGTAYVAGQFVDTRTQFRKAAILNATKKLMNNNPSSNYNIKGEATYSDESLLLNMLGASHCSSPLAADFSLIDLQTQDEISDNPNIFDDERIKKLKKEDSPLKDKFPSKNDPIYELEERKSASEIDKASQPPHWLVIYRH